MSAVTDAGAEREIDLGRWKEAIVERWWIVVAGVVAGIAAGALFSFIVSFDNVPVSIFLLGAGQMTLPVKIFTAIEYGVDPSIAAISTMLIIVTGLGLAAAERWIGFHRFV